MADNELEKKAHSFGIDEIVDPDADIGIETLVADAMADNDPDCVMRLVDDLHYADVADLLERLSREERGQFIDVVRDQFDPEVLAELDETVRDEVVAHLGVREVASALSELDSDDAVEVLEEMDEAQQRAVLDHIPDEERTLIEESLSYPEDSAGRLMQREIVTVPSHWNIGQCIDFVRRLAEEGEGKLPSVFYDIFAIDARHHPVGSIALSKLMSTRRQVPVTEVMDEDMQEIYVNTDQEDVAFMFRQRDLVSAPVVDGDGRLVGAITVDDVVDVIHEEHEEDIMRMGGVTEDDLYSAAISTTRARFSWLSVNLLTAILASVVI
jgi:magnesium transporter